MCSAVPSALAASTPVSGDEVENNGERINPLKRDFNYGYHIAVYDFAVPRVKGKTVADVGCGSGYGSCHLIKSGAAQVQAYEFDPTALRFARENYREPGLAYDQADFNQPLFFTQKYDAVFSSNVLEHLTDVRQGLANIVGLMKPEGEFILAIPCIIESNRLMFEYNNPYHYANLSAKFWRRTLCRCFGSVNSYIQWVPLWVQAYDRLPEAERIENKALSTFHEIPGEIEFNDLSCLQSGHQNLVFHGAGNLLFTCKNPTGLGELADFAECPVSSIRKLAWRNDPATDWGAPLLNGDSVSQDLPVHGWIGAVEFFLGDACQRGTGTAIIELKVSPAAGMPTVRQMTVDLATLKPNTGTPLHWAFYREPIFVPQDATFTMTVRSFAHGRGLFNLPGGTAYGEYRNPFLVRVYSLIQPIPQNTRTSVVRLR